jgi:threonine aldolase
MTDEPEDAVDLRSDTVTRPSETMREAAAAAEVGDDVYGEDPTVNDLEARAADLLGTADALYFPSGTMANQTAVRVHTDRGQEVVCDRWSHVYNYEVTGLAEHASVQPRPVDAERGIPTPEQVREAYVEPGSHHAAGTGLLVLENTHNHRGGLAIAPGAVDAAAEAAHDLGVPVHLDGARLWNAAVAHDVDPARFTREVDSVFVALSKGLGAPSHSSRKPGASGSSWAAGCARPASSRRRPSSRWTTSTGSPTTTTTPRRSRRGSRSWTASTSPRRRRTSSSPTSPAWG